MSVRDFSEKSAKDKHLPDTRGQIVLSAIISEHLVTGEPVGSKSVAEKFTDTFAVSSATIRNVMSELEEMGLVEQPHTSAGRVPTDKGYRFYVDHLLGVLPLSNEDLRLINKEFGLGEGEFQDTPDHLMEKTSQLLSVLSKNIGIVVSPSLAHDRLQHIEFVNLSDKRVLVVLVSSPSIVHNKVIRLNETFTQEELDRTARYLNVEFGGKSLAEIRSEILKLMHEEKALFDKMLQTAIILCSQSIEDEDALRGEVYVGGASNILGNRDFSDFESLRQLLRTMEEKSRLVQILSECIGREHSLSSDVHVIIGSENSAPSLQNCTLITAPYRIGEGGATGSLSVLGPTRIEYARMISVVSYVAKMLEKLMAEEKA
ncbi:MAG TPA: heat-inducible transcriptional repressor HrcA [Pyrinomonadaceae bacterium]|nr:heat-inducible transcriptional repressor HrcA [Pyrinomonadaceae bacterium]